MRMPSIEIGVLVRLAKIRGSLRVGGNTEINTRENSIESNRAFRGHEILQFQIFILKSYLILVHPHLKTYAALLCDTKERKIHRFMHGHGMSNT